MFLKIEWFVGDGYGSPYYSNSEVDAMFDVLLAGNGYWDRTPEELRQMADDIEASTGVTQ